MRDSGAEEEKNKPQNKTATNRASTRTSVSDARTRAKAEALKKSREASNIAIGASPTLRSPEEITIASPPPALPPAATAAKTTTCGGKLTENKRQREEESDSPAEKRLRMDEEMRAFVEKVSRKLDDMPSAEQFRVFSREIGENKKKIDQNSEKIGEHCQKLRSLSDAVERIEKEQIDSRRGLDGRVRSIVGRGDGDACAVEENDGEFERARRSIRVWPIGGKDEKEIKTAVMYFFTSALHMDDIEKSIGKFDVRRAEVRGGDLVFDEVIVRFENSRIRDDILRKGPKLAGFIDGNRRPTCGMRIDVPPKLLPTFNLLQKYGMAVKRKNPSAKKYIKFDDYRKDLYIQVKLDLDEEWINVYATEASEELRKADARKNSRGRLLLSPASKSSTRGTASTSGDDDVFMVPARASWKPQSRPDKK